MCDHSRTIRYGYPRPWRMVGPTLDHIHAAVGSRTWNPHKNKNLNLNEPATNRRQGFRGKRVQNKLYAGYALQTELTAYTRSLGWTKSLGWDLKFCHGKVIKKHFFCQKCFALFFMGPEYSFLSSLFVVSFGGAQPRNAMRLCVHLK